MAALPSLTGTGQLLSDERRSSGSRFKDEFINYSYGCSTSEIEEEDSRELFERKREAAALDTIREEYGGCSFSSDALNSEDCIYVGIGKTDSAMDALQWTLKYSITSSSTVVYLLHVFPETRFIPSPLGKIPINQVSQQQVASYKAQEEGKRREFLQKFIDSCSAAKVKTDTVLIESDMAVKAILNAIPILNIRKLVLGINKSRKLISRGGSGIANEILQKAQGSCEVKVICEGKEMSTHQTGSESPSPLSSPCIDDGSSKENGPDFSVTQSEDKQNNSISCMCFKTKFM